MKYTLTITEAHAAVLTAALDMFARVGTGQLDAILEHPDIRRRILASTNSGIRTDAQQILASLKRQMFQLEAYTSYSIADESIDDQDRVAFEMYQLIRHRVSWDSVGNPPERDWKTMYRVNFDEPMKLSQTPLATITKIDGD